MEEVKLISMVDFVLEKKKGEPFLRHDYKSCLNYAKFLKTPLELGMFIPCDLEGNVMEEPNGTLSGISAHLYVEEYRNAQNLVLFEGNFKYNDYQPSQEWNTYTINGKVIGRERNGIFKNDCFFNLTIEDLTNLDLTLTETAVKQL